jgi:hypothetical protein
MANARRCASTASHRHGNGSDDLRNSSGTTTEHAHRIEHSIRCGVASGCSQRHHRECREAIANPLFGLRR